MVNKITMELQTYIQENSVQIPYTTSLTVFYKKSPSDPIELQANLIQGPAENHYLAIFEENDVNFNCIINNSQHPHVLFDLKKKNENFQFVLRHNSTSILDQLPPVGTESRNASKLHFKQDNANEVNRLEFAISYSLIPTMNIHVKFPGVARTMDFVMRLPEHMMKLKTLIYHCYRVAPHRQSLYHGSQCLYNLGEIGWIFKNENSIELTCYLEAIPLFVNFPDIFSARPYTALPQNTGRDLQRIVQMESSMSHDPFYFIYDRKIVPMNVSLQDCGIGENATVDMVAGLQQISVKCFDEKCSVTKRFAMDLEPIKTTDAEFRKLAQDSEGVGDGAYFIHLSNLFGNKLPQFGEQRPTQYPICLVELYNNKRHEANLFPIFISFFNQVIKIYVANDWSVDYLRDFIEEILGNDMDLSLYQITFDGQCRTGHQILSEFNLWPGCFVKIGISAANATESAQYSVLPTRQEVYNKDMPKPELNQWKLTHHPPAAFERNAKAIIKPFIIDLKLASNR